MASDRQIAQLVLQVDANIAVAQRELQNLARVVRQSTGDMNTSLATSEVAHQRLGRAFGQTRIAQMELSHVVTASVDAYAAGFSPLRIMTLEMGRLAEAATFLGGSGGGGVLGKLAGFMGGPWGIAVLLGVSVLTQLIARTGGASESIGGLVEKMRQQAHQAQLNEQANRVWQNTLEGVEDALRKNKEALDKVNDAEHSQAEKTLAAAITAKLRLEAIISEASANISLARSLYEVQKARSSGPGQRGEIASLGLDTKLGALDAFESKLAKARGDLVTANQQIEEATSAVFKQAATTEDPVELIKKHYDQLIEKARQRAVAEHKVGDELIRQIATLERQKEAAVKAAQEHGRKGSGEFGKQIGFADAEAIAKAAGLTVTSGYRSTAHQAELYNDPSVRRPGNPVAAPGTSAHEGVNGKWALDIAFAPGLSAEKLKKLYGAQGVSLSAVYKEKGHFHIEGSRSQAASAESAAARAAQKQLTDDDQFARESAQLDVETLAARRQLIGGYDTQAELAAEEIEAERKGRLASIQHQLDAKQITQAQAEGLRLQVDDLAAAKEAVVAHRKYVEGLQQAAAAAAQATGFQIDDLKFADDMAKTQGAHRKLQLEILDIQYRQKEADLERLKKTIESNKDFATSIDLQNQASSIQAQIDRLPTEKAQDKSRVERGTMGPLEAYNSELPHELDQVKERLDEIKVEGLRKLNDDLVSATTKALGLKGALGDVVGMLLRLGLDVAEGAILSALHVPKRAAGGPAGAGQPIIVGDGGFPELFVPNTNGVILPRVPRINMPRAANDRGTTYNVHQSFAPNFAGNAATREEVQQMGLMAKYGAVQAIREDARRRARG
jgi:hypothetical protein